MPSIGIIRIEPSNTVAQKMSGKYNKKFPNKWKIILKFERANYHHKFRDKDGISAKNGISVTISKERKQDGIGIPIPVFYVKWTRKEKILRILRSLKQKKKYRFINFASFSLDLTCKETKMILPLQALFVEMTFVSLTSISLSMQVQSRPPLFACEQEVWPSSPLSETHWLAFG